MGEGGKKGKKGKGKEGKGKEPTPPAGEAPPASPNAAARQEAAAPAAGGSPPAAMASDPARIAALKTMQEGMNALEKASSATGQVSGEEFGKVKTLFQQLQKFLAKAAAAEAGNPQPAAAAAAAAPAPPKELTTGNLKSQKGNNIRVVIRVRPFIDREKKQGDTLAVHMPTFDSLQIDTPDEKTNDYTFDRCYWSTDDEHTNENNGKMADQQTLMDELGNDIVQNAMNGFNNTLFAYGQTGAGKTWSVIGGKDIYGPEAGLLPRCVRCIFEQIPGKLAADKDLKIECLTSYLELYGENIRDLLDPKGEGKKLNIANHPKLGIHIPGLVESPVLTTDDVFKLLDFGMSMRSVAATAMNDRSSRSHCVFCFTLTQKVMNGSKVRSQTRAKMNLVDLAGSERQKKTNASGDRLKEGASINQSLTCLAMVISALAKQMTEKKAGKKTDKGFIPFRNSKLTYLLQDALTGNSKTTMIAACSPASSNFDETMSTLRFAHSAKQIETSAKQNKDSDDDIVSALKRQIDDLKKQISEGKGSSGSGMVDGTTADELAALTAMAAKYTESFDEKVQEKSGMDSLRNKALQEMGMGSGDMAKAMDLDKDTPYLMNVADDPSLSGCLLYYIPMDKETTMGADKTCAILLSGLGIEGTMCSITNHKHEKLIISRKGEGRIFINGKALTDKAPMEIVNGDRLMMGRSAAFKAVFPRLATRDQMKKDRDEKNTLGVMERHIRNSVVDHDGEEFEQVRTYVTALGARLGDKVARKFAEAFGEKAALVHEANEITQKLRKEKKMDLRLDVVEDILGYGSRSPTMLVALMCDSKLHAVWDWAHFLSRLDGMRECYGEFETMKSMPAFDDPHFDPWADVDFLDIKELATKQNLEKLSKEQLQERLLEMSVSRRGTNLSAA